MLHLVESEKSGHPGALVARVSESERLAALKRYEILDTPPEAAFDHITALAAELFKAPIAIISFLDGNRLWFKSHHGLDAAQISWAPDLTGAASEPRLRREFNPSFFASVPLRTADGYDLGTLCVIDRQPRPIEVPPVHLLEALAKIAVDHLEQRLAGNQARALSALMASEIDHRAMNSLQFVASLLHLQSRSVEPEAARQLAAAANRVLAVARVHRNFAADETAARIPVMPYLQRLCGELSGILGAPISVEGAEASVPKAQILAIGLVVNELVTNAKKHGDGDIHVTFYPLAGDVYELCVLDHGEGLAEDFSVDEPRRMELGMKVIAALVSQLDGKLTAGANPGGSGACFRVTFPAT